MSNFDQAFEWAMHHEGGLSDHVSDKGGVTKYGISLRFLKSVQPTATRDDIVNLTKLEAEELYREHFWDSYRIDEIENVTLAAKIFDCFINMNPIVACKIFQKALVDEGIDCDVDGIMGSQTIKLMNQVCEQEPDRFLESVVAQQIMTYHRICSDDPGQKVFLDGWMRRAKDLLK